MEQQITNDNFDFLYRLNFRKIQKYFMNLKKNIYMYI